MQDKKKRFFLLVLLLVFSLTGCSSAFTCRSELLTVQDLASCHVGTPDPQQCAFFGQQIVISWNLALELPAELVLDVRYGNFELQSISTQINRASGFWIYRLMNEEYFAKNGIISFRAYIRQNGKEAARWTHYLWTDIIEI